MNDLGSSDDRCGSAGKEQSMGARAWKRSVNGWRRESCGRMFESRETNGLVFQVVERRAEQSPRMKWRMNVCGSKVDVQGPTPQPIGRFGGVASLAARHSHTRKVEMRVVRCLLASACLRSHLSNLNSTALYHNRDSTIDLTRSICGITT